MHISVMTQWNLPNASSKIQNNKCLITIFLILMLAMYINYSITQSKNHTHRIKLQHNH
jgi:hypothetical protein